MEVLKTIQRGTKLPDTLAECGHSLKIAGESVCPVRVLPQHASMLFLVMFALLAEQAYGQQKSPSVLLATSRRAFSAVAWSPDGRYFASAWNTSVLMWDAATNTIAAVCGGHAERVTSVSFSGNGNYMLTSSDDGSVIVYNLKNEYSAIRILPKNEGNPTSVKSAAFSPNGSCIYFSRDGKTIADFLHLLFTDEVSTITYTYSGHSADIYSVQNAKNDWLMLSTAEDGTSILWDTRAHQQIRAFSAYTKSHVPAVLSPDGKHFLSATSADTITVRALDGTTRFTVKEPLRPVNCAAFTADGSHFALALQDGDIAYYNAKTGTAERTFSTQHKKARGVVCSLAFSPDGEFIIAGTENGCLFMWSIRGKPIAMPATPYSDFKIHDVILNRAEKVPEQDYNPEKNMLIPIHANGGARTQAPQTAQDSAQATDGGGQSQTEQTAQAATNNAPIVQAPAPADTSPIPRHQMSVLAGVSSQPSDYFTPSIELAVEYRSFAFYPLYFGGAIALGDALPSKDYPYTYQNAGEPMNQPSMYRLGAQGMAGIAYYFERIQVTALMEVRAGMSARMLWNTQFNPAATTSLYPSAAAGLGIGFLWHGVTGRFGVEYDAHFEFLYSGYIGYSLRLGRKQ